jgi:hypothetical protein
LNFNLQYSIKQLLYINITVKSITEINVYSKDFKEERPKDLFIPVKAFITFFFFFFFFLQNLVAHPKITLYYDDRVKSVNFNVILLSFSHHRIYFTLWCLFGAQIFSNTEWLETHDRSILWFYWFCFPNIWYYWLFSIPKCIDIGCVRLLKVPIGFAEACSCMSILVNDLQFRTSLFLASAS